MKYIETNGSILTRPAGRAAAPPPPRPAADGLCDVLFDAILADDDVDPVLPPPRRVELDFRADQLGDCLALCRRLWSDRYDRGGMVAMLRRLLASGRLDDAGRREFKHVRARLKHLRHAHGLYGAGHAAPRALDTLAVGMGRLQDAYRSDRRWAARRWAAWLGLLVAAGIDRRVARGAGRVRMASPASFRAALVAGYAELAALAARERVTGHEFHAARKIVGRHVSFVDTLRTLDPTDDRYRLSRWLSAINGLMGARHDELVAAKVADPTVYDRPFPLPDEVRRLIRGITALVPAA